MNKTLLSVRNLRTVFVQGGQQQVAVDDISFEIQAGKSFALVGESGSGKSVSALSVLRLLPSNGKIIQGSALYRGEDLFLKPESQMRSVRGKRIAIIFQDPMSSLNPVMTIGQQIGEAILIHRQIDRDQLKVRIVELLDQVGLPFAARRAGEYPHQLSGGMRQRVMIAIALAGEPELVIADEPTTALDVTIQAQVLALLKELQQRNGMALWLITHDFGIVSEIADHVAVMQKGKLVEQAECSRFFSHPQHPYTLELFKAVPSIDHCQRQEEDVTKGVLLKLDRFKVFYPIRKGLLKKVVDHVRAVDEVSFELKKGETLALVGESGCGKTTLGKGLLQLIPNSGGTVQFDDLDLNSLSQRELRQARRKLQIIFQDPFSSMNPRMLVGEIIAEGMKALNGELSEEARRKRVEKLLSQVGLPAESRLRYPHEFSGGQRQRICIARALAVNPELIVCDEPTSALDVSVQAQIIKLLKTLQKEKGLSYLFISHDLAVVAEIAHRVAVMKEGRIVEIGETEQVLKNPQHPYTKTLISAVPKLNAEGFKKIELSH
ncbi:MAG: ABC transporter ATP-binding protein [Gammaproteobacteria bacterium]|nr:MAG: ABC transporter ATP-binding protein [Gammaproteobacteria bacterium]